MEWHQNEKLLYNKRASTERKDNVLTRGNISEPHMLNMGYYLSYKEPLKFSIR